VTHWVVYIERDGKLHMMLTPAGATLALPLADAQKSLSEIKAMGIHALAAMRQQ